MDATQSEEWRPITGWEYSYEVSNRGRVRSKDRVVSHGRNGSARIAGRILKAGPNRAGYRVVNLSRVENGAQKVVMRYVHHLVLQEFCGPCPPGFERRHLDGDPLNNDINNLRYGTSSENSFDTSRHGRNWLANKTHCKRGHEFNSANTYKSPEGHRRCRTCKRDAERSRRSKARLAGNKDTQ